MQGSKKRTKMNSKTGNRLTLSEINAPHRRGQHDGLPFKRTFLNSNENFYPDPKKFLDNQSPHQQRLFCDEHSCINPQTFPLSIRSTLSGPAQEMSLKSLIFFKKTTSEVMKALNGRLASLSCQNKITEKTLKLVSKYLVHIKEELFAENRILNQKRISDTKLVAMQLGKSGCIRNLIVKLEFLGFEDRKQVCVIMSNLLRGNKKSQAYMAQFFEDNQDLLLNLLAGYRSQGLALTCGNILRECCRHETLAKQIMNAREFSYFFDFIEDRAFEVASDAFLTFETLLMQHAKLTELFLHKNYDTFFHRFEKLVTSENYVTQITSLKLLASLLLCRQNFKIMSKYIANPANLKIIMKLMSNSPSNIQFEAYHIFKIFASNPNPHPRIRSIFLKNYKRLATFLSNFQSDRNHEEFHEEKMYLVKTIRDLTEKNVDTKKPKLR